jgi:hypothetical protein
VGVEVEVHPAAAGLEEEAAVTAAEVGNTGAAVAILTRGASPFVLGALRIYLAYLIILSICTLCDSMLLDGL